MEYWSNGEEENGILEEWNDGRKKYDLQRVLTNTPTLHYSITPILQVQSPIFQF